MTSRRPAPQPCAPGDPRCRDLLCDACSAEKLAALLASGALKSDKPVAIRKTMGDA